MVLYLVLHGSIDQDDMQINQLNFKPPSLYLWSRADWTMKYKVIASKQGHEFKVQQEPPVEERTQAEEQDVHLPRQQILERFEREASRIQQSTRKEETNKKTQTLEEEERFEKEATIAQQTSREVETNKKIGKASRKREPLGDLDGWGTTNKRTKRRTT